jgi:hypothetical protein
MAAFLRPGFCTTSKHARTSLMIGFVCAICIADTTARGHSGAKAASQLRPLAIEVSGCRLTVKQSRFRCRAIGRRSSHPARLTSSINSQVATEFRHSQRCSRGRMATSTGSASKVPSVSARCSPPLSGDRFHPVVSSAACLD